MDLIDEARQSEDPAAQQRNLEASADTSTSRLDGPATLPTTSPTKPRIELLSDGSSDEEGALDPDVSRAQSPEKRPENAGEQSESSAVKQTPPPAATPTKVKVFLKSTSPDLPLHIFMPKDLPLALSKKLQIAIRAHGGVLESRFGKADLIIVDPQMTSASRKLLRDANQIGQPIPVVILDYIQDSVSQGQKIDFEDPKYKYDGTQTQPDHSTMAAAVSAHASRSLNGRNPFTESDREAIISYFIDKDQSTWSLNAAAKELANQIPSHTKTSFQSYLQNNFEKGWNLRDKVLQARQAALDAEPSELQARILRSQYTASPPTAEQSAPSDGWPRSSSPPSVQEEPDQPSAAIQQNDAADEQVDAAEEDDQDLEVRQPNPGANVEDVERSPTKANRHTGHAASEESSPPPSLQFPHSRPSSLEPAPQQRTAMPTSPSANEESDPEEFSPTILAEIERQESSRLKSSQNVKKKLSRAHRRSGHSSDSSEDSESDQLIQSDDEILLATTTPAREAGAPADDSEDGEWDGTRSADKKLREKELQKDTERIKKGHIKFTDEEKAELLRQLAAHVREQGRVPDGLTQDVVLAKPPDVFWERFATDNPTHSTLSWRSHYLKNRATYKEMIDLEIDDDGSDEGEDSDQGVKGENVAEDQQDDVDLNGIVNPGSSSQRPSPPVAKPDSGRDLSEQPDVGSDGFDETSLPADGIVVLIPGPPGAHGDLRERSVTPRVPKSKEADMRDVESQDDTQRRWPDAATPPLMEEEAEEEDMMQVEAEIDAMPDSSQRMLPESRGSPASSEADDIVIPQEASVVETTSGLVAHVETEEPAAGFSNMPSRHAPQESSARRESSAGSSSSDVLQRRHSRAVDAGTPVLPQHRDAPFYDFTIDSDEEQRLRKARSRPSLPNLASGQQGTSSRSPRPSGSHHLSHFATPSRSQRATAAGTAQPPTRQPAGERKERTPESARSDFASPSSGSPDLHQEVEPVVVAQPSRSRAKRIDRRPLLSADYPAKFSPKLERGSAQHSRRASEGRGSVALSRTERSPVRSPERPAGGHTGASASRLDSEVARMHHRAEVDRFRARVEHFRLDFGLDKQQLRDVLVPFKANVKDARVYIERWLMQMGEAYGVQASVAFEYVKTSRGDFEQAETFLRLATMTRSGSIPSRLDGTSSRSASHSVSPVKRGARSDERSMSRGEAREGSRVASSSSKRLRR